MKQPNVLLLALDAGRVDHVSCYGYEKETTPYIDQLAKEGVLFENAISPAVWTVPSHASMFTGMYLSGHGLRGRQLKLRDDIPTLASFLGAHGYQTAAITANSLISHATGLARGFSDLIDANMLIQGESLRGWQKRVNSLYQRAYYGQRPSQGSWYDSGAWRLNREMKRWLGKWQKAKNERPFFIFANYMEPHLKYCPPRAFREKFLTPAQEKRWRQVNQNAWKYMSGDIPMSDSDWEILIALYNAEMAYVDMRIGEMIEYLRQQGILDNTMVILTSDHGENLGDHGMMDHQYCVYDTLAHVPMIVRYPDAFAQGSRESGLVQSVDIFATIAKLIGQQNDPRIAQIQGQSMLAEDIQQNGRKFAITEYLAPQLHSFKRSSVEADVSFERQLRAIRTQTHKYIWTSDENHELYDLATDPGETNNLIHNNLPEAQQLAKQLDAWLSSHTYVSDENMEDVDEAVVGRLEALGYI